MTLLPDTVGPPRDGLAAAPLPGARPFTAEQRAAVQDRGGSLLLAANAGSGKTAVMVERFAEAVLVDGVDVAAILALTFTEKAAGELRERVRGRFASLGRDDLARDAEGAWIGTIHGFCARLLRAHALSAGLDPRFTVLDDAASRRLHERAFADALDAWVAAHGGPAVDLLAAFADGALRELVEGAHAELRSRGRPVRLPLPAAPSAAALTGLRTALAAARGAAAGVLGAVAAPGVQVRRALDALEACEPLCGGDDVPVAGTLTPATLPGGSAKALADPACEAYREALNAYARGCADHHAAASLVLLDDLLTRFAAVAQRAKDLRGVVDFEDLQLRVRDLLTGDVELRERWAGRFALLMVDEFQDTNRVQLELLEALERDNLFVVGDEQQSIYGFRHADVGIFRARRATGRVRTLRTNFRSRPEILAVLDHAFAPVLGGTYTPLVAGRPPSEPPVPEGLLFDPDRVPGATAPGEPAVELVVTTKAGWEEHVGELGLAHYDAPPARRAEARVVAARIRAEIDGGRRPGEVVVLLRQTGALRLFEQALEDEGVPTYVVGGRGYWSAAPVRDGLAWLSVLANPLDEEALLCVLASPFAGVGSDELIALAAASREPRRPLWETLTSADAPPGLRRVAATLRAERALAPRLGGEELLERAIRLTGYDLTTLALPGGDRRLANLRKLMRLAREYERAEGRDLRGFLDHARDQDLANAREGEAPLEAEGLEAVRLMTAHRAKGLEFPVVVVADLGRRGRTVQDRLLLADDGRLGVKLPQLDRGEPTGAFAYDDLVAERAAREDEEERRLLYVALTRAEERLIVSGVADPERWPAPRPGGEPIHWLAPALAGPGLMVPAGEGRDRVVEPAVGARLRVRVVQPGEVVAPRQDGRVTPPAPARLAPTGPHPGDVTGARDAAPPDVEPPGPRPESLPDVAPAAAAPPRPPGPTRLSYTALAAHRRCGYRFYLERVLRLPADPDEDLPPDPHAPGESLEARLRGSLVHAVIERADLAADPTAPLDGLIAAAAAGLGVEPPAFERDDVARLARAFLAGPLRDRILAARGVRRELPFAFAAAGGPSAPLVSGFLDLVAEEAGGALLVVDVKTDRIDPATDLVAATRERYGVQRLVYALAALASGAPRVEVAYAWLERPADPVVAAYSQADRAALEAELEAVAAPVLRGEHVPAAVPHRELCAGCPGRRALCHHPRELTARPRPA